LLEEIKKKHKIEYEIVDLRITKKGYVDEIHKRKIYEKTF